MLDPQSEDGKKSTGKDRWYAWLEEGPGGKRIIIGLIFFIVLALFLHFREVRMQTLDLNTKSEQYVIAQVAFDFPDEESTKILKQEAVRDIGPIYKIDETQLESKRLEFENFLVKDQSWRDKLPDIPFDQVYHESEKTVRLLLQSRFTDPRTLQKMKTSNLSTTDVYPLSSTEIGRSVFIPKAAWENIRTLLLKEYEDQADSVNFALNFYSNERWNLQQDVGKERALRQHVEAGVPTKYTKVEPGSFIIVPGEIVTARHIAMLGAMKKALGEERNIWSVTTILGSLLLSLILTALCIIYLKINHRDILGSVRKLTLLVTIVILTLIIAKVTEYFLINKTSNLIDVVRYPIFVPFASIIICALISPQAALFSSGFLAVVLGISLAVDHDRFLVINLIAALVAILCARSMHKRKEVFGVCAKVWVSCALVIVAFHLISGDFWNLNLMTDFISTMIFLAFTAIVVVGLLPVLESIFHVLTDMSLMEYMDPNNELLRRLSLEAPGTYQHCLVVGNLAEAAARAIGANGLFCRVSTLYHDIGKLYNPPLLYGKSARRDQHASVANSS